MYLPVYIPVYLSVYLPVYLPVYLRVYLPVYIPVCFHVYLPVYLHVYIPVYFHVFQLDKIELDIGPDSIFNKLGECGLIAFSDYVFLLTVLSSKSAVTSPLSITSITLFRS